MIPPINLTGRYDGFGIAWVGLGRYLADTRVVMRVLLVAEWSNHVQLLEMPL
jgi:hypothetical protein